VPIFVGLSHYTDPACPLEELFSRSHQVYHNSTAAPIPLILREQGLQTAQVLDAGWVGCLSNNRRIFSAFLCFIYRYGAVEILLCSWGNPNLASDSEKSFSISVVPHRLCIVTPPTTASQPPAPLIQEDFARSRDIFPFFTNAFIWLVVSIKCLRRRGILCVGSIVVEGCVGDSGVRMDRGLKEIEGAFLKQVCI